MGGPNSIIGNNPIQGSGYNPRQEGAAKAPNLKDFVLTIDDFRQFASGKYNAGINPGNRVGAHHAWERLESKDIDPSEAASIRLAFAFALEDAGVSGDKMAAACKRLGLEADFSFSNDDSTVYTSLSRKEVRDIIDQSLGKHVGNGRAEQPKAEVPRNFEIIDDDDNQIIDNIDNKVKFNRDDDYVKDDDKIELIEKHYDFEENDSSEKGDVKIKNKDLELNEEQRKYIANLNFNTLVEALLLRYGENFNFTRKPRKSSFSSLSEGPLYSVSHLESCSSQSSTR